MERKMTTSVRSRDLIQPVLSGQSDDARFAGASDQADRQAASSAALKLRLLTRAAMASAYMILGFLVYALNL
jgi:hypothetical protein